jgi:DNA replication and repair protein RecF
MYLTHLSLTNFRNFTRLDADIPLGSILMVGANAQGKTSLLEAIYFLATFTSFHAHNDRQLVNFIAGREDLSVARIVATFCLNDKEHRFEVRIIQETGDFNGSVRSRKEALLNGVKLKINEAVGKFNAVLFLPQMLRVIEGAPEERRRYFNLALSQVISRYPEMLSDYSRTLSQRNALLKQLNERGGDREQLTYWDAQLANSGSQIIYARIQAIKELEYLSARIHQELTRGGAVLRISYQPAYDPLPQPPGQYELPLDAPITRQGFSLDQIREGFKGALFDQRRDEIARGVTTIGPHRDEVRFLENGVDLGIFGSRGQNRTAMLALKLAEVEWMKAKTNQSPILLLDEVLAELDSERRRDLLNRLSVSEQALLTTTDLDLFSEDYVKNSTLWYIKGGVLET